MDVVESRLADLPAKESVDHHLGHLLEICLQVGLFACSLVSKGFHDVVFEVEGSDIFLRARVGHVWGRNY